MAKKRVKKKVVRKSKKHHHDKPFIITFISLFAVLVVFLLFLFADNFVGKSFETGNVTCINYCKFSTSMDLISKSSETLYVIVPEGESTHATFSGLPVKIFVKNIEEINGVKKCNFGLILPNLPDNTDFGSEWFVEYSGFSFEDFKNLSFSIGETITLDESLFSGGNTNDYLLDLLKLEEIGCQECIDIDDDNDVISDYSEFGEFNVTLDDKHNLIDYSFKGTYALDDSGKLEDSCQSPNIIKEAVCNSNGTASFVEKECPSGLGCVDGVCVKCSKSSGYYGGDYVRLLNEFTTSEGKYLDSLYIDDVNNYCKDNKTLIEYSCSDNKVLIEESSCSGSCSLASGVGICFDGCSDSDGEDAYVQGEITGLKLENWGNDYDEKIKVEKDGCLNGQVVEKYCDGNYIKEKLLSCSEGYSCDEGACVQPKIFKIWEDSKTSVGFKPIKNISTPFWVVISLKGEDNGVILFKKTLYHNATKDESFYNFGYYSNDDLIKKKEVLVYDVDDPSEWTVYLNKPFVVEYNET
jgi:hypothetical protein